LTASLYVTFQGCKSDINILLKLETGNWKLDNKLNLFDFNETQYKIMALKAIICQGHSSNHEKEDAKILIYTCNIKFIAFLGKITTTKFQVSSIKFPVSSFQYQVSSIKFPVSSFQYQVSSIKFPMLNLL